MKVYILWSDWDACGDAKMEGIFATHAAAERARQALPSKWETWITEEEVSE